jgi:hypothetical protein
VHREESHAARMSNANVTFLLARRRLRNGDRSTREPCDYVRRDIAGFVYPPKGTALMIIGGVNFLLGIVVGILGRRFARPGATVASSQRAGHAKMAKMLGEEVLEVMLEAIGGFFLGLVVLYPLLTFAFSIALIDAIP